MAYKAPRISNAQPSSKGWSDIKQNVIDGKLDPDKAVKLIEVRGRTGLLAAGQLGVHYAMAGGDIDQVVARLGRAKQNFERVVDYRALQYPDHVVARARLYLAQMPVYAAVSSTQLLPSERPAKLAYDATVKLGVSLSIDFERMRLESDPTMEDSIKQLAGVLAKIAGLGLAQRHAVRNEISQTWFSLLVSYNDGYLDSTTEKPRKPYDIGFYTTGDFSDAPERRVHVLASQNTTGCKPQYDPDVAQIVVSEHLRLEDGIMTVTTIPTELGDELAGKSPESTVRLDLRTKELLKALRLTSKIVRPTPRAR